MEKYYHYRNSRIIFILLNFLIIFLLSILKVLDFGIFLIWIILLFFYCNIILFNMKRIYNNCIYQMEKENHDNLEKIVNSIKRED